MAHRESQLVLESKTINSDYDITDNDCSIIVDSTLSSIDISLPDPTTVPKQVFFIVCRDIESFPNNIITVNVTNGTINGESSFVFNTKSIKSIQVQSYREYTFGLNFKDQPLKDSMPNIFNYIILSSVPQQYYNVMLQDNIEEDNF